MNLKKRIKHITKVGDASVIRVNDVEGFCPPKYTKTDSRPLISPRTMGSKNFVMVFNMIEPGGEVKVHEHDAEHGYYVIRGKMGLKINGEEKEVSQGSAIYIPPWVKHGLKSIGNEDLQLLMIYAPPM
jgi:quercetin dioxygenase-like cupin family protein